MNIRRFLPYLLGFCIFLFPTTVWFTTPIAVYGMPNTDTVTLINYASTYWRQDFNHYFERQQQRELMAKALADTEYSLTEIPMLHSQGGWGPVEINTNVGDKELGDGNPIQMSGTVYNKGFGVQATSIIVFDLEGKCSTFSATVGIDDEVATWNGSVIFQVYTDGEKVYESNSLLSGNAGFPAVQTGLVSIESAHELMLVVDNSNGNYFHDTANWADPVVTCSSKPNGDGSSFKHIRGSWEPVMDWPVKAIHASLLPSGHIMSHASQYEGSVSLDFPNQTYTSTKIDLADIDTWSHEWINHNSEEMYCSAHVLNSDGNVFEFGGHDGLNYDENGAWIVEDGIYGRDQASIFDFDTKTWVQQPDMEQARWYPSAVTLGNGDVLAIGGTHGTNQQNIFKPEVFDGQSWRTLTNVDYENRLINDYDWDHIYPFVNLTSDGRVFWSGWDSQMAYIDTTGEGSWGQHYEREGETRPWGSPVMYRQDKILLIGGMGVDSTYYHATETVQQIDLTNGAPVTRYTNDMWFPRTDADSAILANGDVWINGGSYYHILGENPSAVYFPETWNPDTEEWALGSPATNPRGYHSTTLLLPTGQVWTAGGECDDTDTGESCSLGMTAQVYNPPYLFKQDGSGDLADRPTINNFEKQITYGQKFWANVSADGDVSKLTFIRLGSTTHHINFEQRYLELEFEQTGEDLLITAPEHGNLAPPGYYMLFAFDSHGVPSEAKMVQILPADEMTWEPVTASDNSQPTARHESAYVAFDNKFYLMGGRDNRPLEVFDPLSKKWMSLGTPPVNFHHFQPVVYNDLIYVIGAFVGDYPAETPVERIYTYNPANNSWTVGPQIPAARQRGSAGAVMFNNKIYLVGGSNNGHQGGYQPWFDVFDPATETWETLPDAPHARDHFMAVTLGNKLYVVGGRQTDLPNPFDKTIPAVDVFDFVTEEWSSLDSTLSPPRAGANVVTYGSEFIVIGGESDTQSAAHNEVQAYDVLTNQWRDLPNLITGRHSGGAVIWNHEIYAASGSNQQGGSEVSSQEKLSLAPMDEYIVAFPTPEPTQTPTPKPTETPSPTSTPQPTATPVIVPTADPNEPLPIISVADASANEGDTTTNYASFAITLDQAISASVAVEYTTQDGSAVAQSDAGSDYVSQSGTIVIPAGETSFILEITIIEDTLVEPNETFQLILSNPQNAELGDSEATGTILNDDVNPSSGSFDHHIYLPQIEQP
ncbi:MAG: NPCBM/NEW2 domain-containing protein [Chloroflexota bacterium]